MKSEKSKKISKSKVSMKEQDQNSEKEEKIGKNVPKFCVLQSDVL